MASSTLQTLPDLSDLTIIIFSDNFRIDWSSSERYEIIRRVGGGKYSEVSQFKPLACNMIR